MKKIALLLFLVTFSLASSVELYINSPLEYTSPQKHSDSRVGESLKKLIRSADKSIHFAIYGIREQKEILDLLVAAQQRGVIVKGVIDTDYHGRNYYSDYNDIKTLLPDIRTDGRSYIMHNKFFLFDKEKVWSGSTNLSNTGTGGYNANSVVVVKNKQLVSYYLKEFYQMYGGKFQNKKLKINTQAIEFEDTVIELAFSPKSNTYLKYIRGHIKNARTSIDIPIFYLTNINMAKDLIAAQKRGVKIRIILDASAARNMYSIHRRLRAEGIEVKVENWGGKMHIKSAVIDKRVVVAGSMNFTKAGVHTNDENTLIISNKKLGQQYSDAFEEMWNSIPNKYLHFDPSPESLHSKNSCNDGIDNDFDRTVDQEDKGCRQ